MAMVTMTPKVRAVTDDSRTVKIVVDTGKTETIYGPLQQPGTYQIPPEEIVIKRVESVLKNFVSLNSVVLSSSDFYLVVYGNGSLLQMWLDSLL